MYKIKIFLSLLFGLLALHVTAQDRTLLEGRVLIFDTPLENVHARNVSSGRSVVTDYTGEFVLNAKVGDTLLFTHLGMNDYIRFIYGDDMRQGSIQIKMTPLTNELDEVTIYDASKINAVSLGIMSKEVPVLTTNERRLQTAGDFKWIHLLGILGGNLKIDPILNAINGRTKQLKRNILIEKKILNIAILEGYSDYMQNSMNLTELQMGRLISLAVEEEKLQLTIDSKNDEQMHLFLIDTWLKFKDPGE